MNRAKPTKLATTRMQHAGTLAHGELDGPEDMQNGVQTPSPLLSEPSAVQHQVARETLIHPVRLANHSRKDTELCNGAPLQESPAPAREASTSAGLKVGGWTDRTLLVAAVEYLVPLNFDQRPGLAMSAAVAGDPRSWRAWGTWAVVLLRLHAAP